MSELKKCPFCGSSVELILRGNAFSKSRSAEIKCSFCPCFMKVGAIHNNLQWCENKITEIWNRRFPNPKED